MKKALYILFTFITCTIYAQETISFLSGDGLVNVTADKYIDNSNTQFILLCHQAGYSRGEYIETAPILVGLGYNCMAIDQRSGNAINGITNQTAADAAAAGISQNFTDAIPDIEAAIDIAYELNNNNPIYLFGSSYSSALALIIGRDNSKVKATIAFSPGEYLDGIDVSQEISSYTKPVFVTSSQSEISGVTNLVSGISPTYLTHFQPTVAGLHGSKTLWSTTAGHEQYWTALVDFLTSILKTEDTIVQHFSIFPNPSKDVFTINTKETIQKIEVFNLLGQNVLSLLQTNEVNLQKMEKATYILKIQTEKTTDFIKIIHN